MEGKNGLHHNAKKREEQFFCSLSFLCSLYDLNVPKKSDLPFPINILDAFQKASVLLKDKNPALRLLIILDNAKAIRLATVQVFDTGTCLYYIPVKPLVAMMEQQPGKPFVNLLLSVFAYLLQIAKVPYYRDNSSYLNYCYGVIEEFMTDEGEYNPKQVKANRQLFKKMATKGDMLLAEIKSGSHLRYFKERICSFSPANKIETALLELAKRIYEIKLAYPGRTILNNILQGFIEPQVEERITADRYISFFWDSCDEVYEQLMDYCNAELQEYQMIDEPVSIQVFDSPQERQTHDLLFETALFSLLDELCYLLTQLHKL